MNRASRVAVAAWSDGKAPKTIGDAVKPDVYISKPSKASIRARPAGEPFIE